MEIFRVEGEILRGIKEKYCLKETFSRYPFVLRCVLKGEFSFCANSKLKTRFPQYALLRIIPQ